MTSPGSSARSALVTGAGRGIGRAIAVRLAADGWQVYGGVRGDAAARSLAGESDRITPVQLDVTVSEQVAALDSLLPDRLDALVNNVGIAVGGPVETVTTDDMRRQFETNLFGPLAVTQAVLPRLRRSRGRIVFISSLNGRVSFPLSGLYNASKFAVEAVADCLRVELAPFGVQVVLIEPGVIDTDPWHEMDELIDGLEAALDPQMRAVYSGHFAGERQLIGRIRKGAAPPDTVARVVARELTRRRARPRALVGRDARALTAMRAVLPTRAMDAVWTRGLGLDGEATRAAAAARTSAPT